MTWVNLIKYGIKTYIEYLSKRSIYAWGIKYFSISIVSELVKASFNERIELIYTFLENEVGAWAFLLAWVIFEIILGGFSIFFVWISIPIKIGLVVFFSFLHYKKTTSSSIFRPNTKWFEFINNKFYSEEIKSKYVNELHQDLQFQKNELDLVTKFDELKISSAELINEIQKTIVSFENNYNAVLEITKTEKKELPDYKPYRTLPNLLNTKLIVIVKSLKSNSKFLKQNGFKILKDSKQPILIEIESLEYINYKPRERDDFQNWEKQEQGIFYRMLGNYNETISAIHSLNERIKKINKKSIFIAGNAGVGKTHLSAHLTAELKGAKNYPILISAKKFSGESTDLDRVFLNLLNIPDSYQLRDVLLKINKFAVKKNRRVYFIIDGLNETTDNNIGFNKMWKIHLESFTNQIKQFSHLFLICTLRKSYVDRVWAQKPKNLLSLDGFNHYDVREACELYFKHFKINASNLKTANLDFFRVPLLLDLFCKLKNGSRTEEVTIALNVHSYIEIFQGYITKLKNEVRTKMDLASLMPINEGFDNSASRFLVNNDAICSNDDFVLDFDNNPLVRNDESIAKAILEGYLIYIKDYIGHNDDEVIMFTQQEVGGFLLADKIVSDFPLTQDLIDSDLFKEKLIGNDEDKIHQLRYDILKFLVALKPDLILKHTSSYIQSLTWWYLYNSDYNLIDGYIVEHISNSFKKNFTVSEAVRESNSFWFVPEHPFNFSFFYKNLKKLSQWEYDLSWSSFIYAHASEIKDIINDYLEELKGDNDLNIKEIKTKFIITILSTNIRELRDIATNAILAFGIGNPLELLNLTVDSKNLNDIYIYERMVHCCYGVSLNNQNEESFVNDVLPKYSKSFFKMQFAENTDTSVYNYIVTDSIKHIIDLSILKGVFELNDDDLSRVKNYQFVAPYDWIEPTQEEQNVVDASREMSPPDPLRMDFGIYTIPRLTDREVLHPKIAIANIWRRIIQLGFELLDLNQGYDEIDKDFHWGHKVYRFKGKVDRLGKKYCWIAFFDYAGKLLLDEKLNVWYKGDSSYEPHYERLGDVDIDISRPGKDYIATEQIFFEDLLKEKRKANQNWNEIDKIDLVKDLFNQSFESDEYTLLYGFIDQKEDESYDTRTFLKIESIFINRVSLENIVDIENKVYEWDDDIDASPSYLYDVYFGELYWADSVPSIKKNYNSFPTGKLIKGKKYLTARDLIQEKYKNYRVGNSINIDVSEKIGIETEPTLMDYRWESDSELFKTFGEFVPSSNLGKQLGLRPDCKTGNILDANLDIATKSVEYMSENFYSSHYNFLRTDLLNRYMEEKNLALIYQVKQFSYDKLSQSRKLKFFINK